MGAAPEQIPFSDLPVMIFWLENCLKMVFWGEKHLPWFAVEGESMEEIWMGSACLSSQGEAEALLITCLALRVGNRYTANALAPQSLKRQ